MKYLLEVILGRRLPVGLLSLPRRCRRARGELRRVVVPQRPHQPARMDADDDHEQLQGKQQVNRLEDLHDAIDRTVEVVNVESASIASSWSGVTSASCRRRPPRRAP